MEFDGYYAVSRGGSWAAWWGCERPREGHGPPPNTKGKGGAVEADAAIRRVIGPKARTIEIFGRFGLVDAPPPEASTPKPERVACSPRARKSAGPFTVAIHEIDGWWFVVNDENGWSFISTASLPDPSSAWNAAVRIIEGRALKGRAEPRVELISSPLGSMPSLPLGVASALFALWVKYWVDPRAHVFKVEGLSLSAALAELGLGPEAGEADVRRAYKCCALETHPDRGGEPSAFRRVTEAKNAALRFLAMQ